MTDETNTRTRSSRRTVLKLTLATFVAGLAPRAPAQQKVAQNVVQYQDKPKNGQQCDQCMHFVAPASCKVVEGKISPNGWCALFAPKPK